MIYLPEADDIYFPKIREYFKEVISSYSNGNYRSATVMLYSVTICDILLKLQELKDMYNDKTAASILKEIEQEQKGSSSKSSWEKTLLERIRDRTKLLDSKTSSDLQNLFDDRNFSAHPATNENFELYSPSQETVIAHIKNILNEILTKPPIFIQDIVSMLTDDLKEKRDIYLENTEQFSQYLNNKYFNKMPLAMKIKTAKVLWRFCFKNIDNEDCKANRKINRRALTELINTIFSFMQQEIKDHKDFYTVARDDHCEFELTGLLADIPPLYEVLDDGVKLQLDKFIDNNAHAKWGVWFKFKSLDEHIQFLKDSRSLEIKAHNINYAFKKYCEFGQKHLILDFFICLYAESSNFDTADLRYNNLIQPYLKEFSRTQIIEIIRVTNSNGQIYARGCSFHSNTQIIRKTKDLLVDFDFTEYPNFRFDETVLNQNVEDSEYAD